MDSKLKRTVIALAIFTGLIVLVIVGFANVDSLKKKLDKTSSSVEKVEETVVSEQKDSLQIGKNLNAWKNDDSFFDSEAETLAKRIKEEMLTLDIKAFSIENDLRVHILDYEGKDAKDYEYSVKVASTLTHVNAVVKEYKDTDKDGIIYIDDLRPGEYEVSLNPVDGYKVPDNPLTITIKDKVEYSYIEDIDVLFADKTDSEANMDDLMTVGALEYASKSQNTKYALDYKNAYGIDLTEDYGDVDFEKVYDSGIRFVMLRAGYRGAISGDIIPDKKFSEYADAALSAGLNVGAYFYSQAVSEREGVEEASALIKMCEDSIITYPLVIRMDQAGGLGRADGLDAEKRTGIAMAFLDTISKTKYDPCIYASSNWLNTNLDKSLLEKYDIWMAEYGKTVTYKGYYDYWQYTANGKVPGIEGNVPLTISYK